MGISLHLTNFYCYVIFRSRFLLCTTRVIKGGEKVTPSYLWPQERTQVLKHNLHDCSSESFCLSILGMPHNGSVWDPHESVNIQTLEKVQQRAARWVLSDYGRQSSVTKILTQLSWPTLKHCHFTCRPIFFIKLLMELFL